MAESEGTFLALLVDYGGVLTTSMGRAFATFCAEHGVDPDRMKDVIVEAYGGADPDGMVARIETGRADLGEFEAWLAERLSAGLPAPIHPTGLRDRIFAGMPPDGRMIAAVRRARAAGIRTALVSNSWGPSGFDAERFPDTFDAVVVSGQVGARKPDPEIYLHAAREVDLAPQRCVFVDDLEQNVRGAHAVGMEAFVHRNADLTIPRLESLLGLRLRDGAEAGDAQDAAGAAGSDGAG